MQGKVVEQGKMSVGAKSFKIYVIHFALLTSEVVLKCTQLSQKASGQIIKSENVGNSYQCICYKCLYNFFIISQTAKSTETIRNGGEYCYFYLSIAK